MSARDFLHIDTRALRAHPCAFAIFQTGKEQFNEGQ